MTLANLYRLSTQEGDGGAKARQLLLQTDWFARMSEFDPRSGESLTQALTPFLRKVEADLRSEERWKIQDRLSRLTDHSRLALMRVIKSLNENPSREHAEMAIRDVRELDAACFRKLSNRPGRTIREKLAARPYLQAVRRFQSIDLPENRLVKAFAWRLVELLRERAECLGGWLGECPDDLIELLDRWLRSDEAHAISKWENPPPNNMLLSHRDYRRIYDSWRWLQSLDDDVARDLNRFEERQSCIDFWKYAAELRFVRDVALEEVPVGFDYDAFAIVSRLGCIMVHDGKRRGKLLTGTRLDYVPKRRPEDPRLPQTDSSACIDFTGESSVFTTGGRSESLPATLAWQLWGTGDGRESISLFEAQSVYEGEGVHTVKSSDFFSAPDAMREHAYEAAMSIAADLRRVFRSDSLAWLVPDIVDDFQLTPLRQGINAVFSNAEPIPRSIAAAFQMVDVTRIKKEGFAVAIVDGLNGDAFVTKLVARYDAKLEAALPETRGYAWERQPAVRIEPGNVDALRGDHGALKKLVGWFVFSISLRELPVLGGFKLHEMEECVQDIPLWYDQLPALSTKIPINGVYDHFYFVEEKNAKVSPRRGVARVIPIEQEFTLPAGQERYEFPLYMGNGNDASQFVASLTSPLFPLRRAVCCSLRMTYTYGASQPYVLTFIPHDTTIKPMTVAWEPKKIQSVNPSNLIVPEFPTKSSWVTLVESNCKALELVADTFDEILACVSGARSAEFVAKKRQRFEKRAAVVEEKRSELADRIADCQKHIEVLEGSWKEGEVNSYVLRDKKDAPYCFVRCGYAETFSHSSHWAGDISPESLSRGDHVWISCQPDSKPGKFFGMWMSRNPDRPQALDNRIADLRRRLSGLEGSLRGLDEQLSSIRAQQDSISEADILPEVEKSIADKTRTCWGPILLIWDNAHSCHDEAAPEWFRQRIENALRKFDAVLRDSAIPHQFKDLIARMLYPIHKDIPISLVEADQRDIGEHGTSAVSVRQVGYALGDAGLEWQQRLLGWMLSQAKAGYFPILRTFSIALWRCESLVGRLTDKDCNILCQTLQKSIKAIGSRIEKESSANTTENGTTAEKLYVAVASARYNFEVMLALIRVRKSSNVEAARMFVPGSSTSTMLLDLVDSFAKVLASHRLPLVSRISLNIKKPKGFSRMPDLLFALRLLLSGDDGANTISINEVGDDEAVDVGIVSSRVSSRPNASGALPPGMSGLFGRKISALGKAVGVVYMRDKKGIQALQHGILGCQYWTKDSSERPWEQAFVCVHPKYGCHETHGGICEYWNKMGGWTGSLGFPTSDEEDFHEGDQLRGRVSHFEHGDVLWLNDENRIDVRMKS